MLARKRRKLIIIISIIVVALILIATLITLYLTTDIFKPKDTLFAKYLLQNVSNIEEMAKKQPTGIKDAIQNQKLETNATAKLSYTDSNGDNTNNVNQAELDISSKIDKQSQYDYKNIRLVYENEEIAKMEYLKNNENYGIRLGGIEQFASATNQNLDELSLTTGISKENLELMTYIFEPITLSQFISFTPEETNFLSSTYLGIVQQKTQKNQYYKSKETLKIGDNTYQATAYSLRLTEEQLNDLIITMLEEIGKSNSILLQKFDTIEQQLKKYSLYHPKEDKPLRDIIVEMINDEIQEIKNHNIGQEQTEITVYVYKGQTIRTVMKTPKESYTIDIEQSNGIKFNHTQNLDNSVVQNNFNIERKVEDNKQNIIVVYNKLTDDKQDQSLQLEIKQNKEENKMENAYHIQYNMQGNVATIEMSQYINIVDNFEEQINFDDKNNVSLNNLKQDEAQAVVEILKNNFNNKIKNILKYIPLEQINKMLKDLEILKENEITFDEDDEEEIVSDAERARFNSELTFFIGKEVSKETVQQLIDVSKNCLKDAQIMYEDEQDENKKRIRGIIMDIKRETANDEKTQELTTALEKEKTNVKYTVAMAFDETTRLINQITIVSNEFLQE